MCWRNWHWETRRKQRCVAVHWQHGHGWSDRTGGWMSSVGVWEKSADHLVSVAVWGIWQAGLESHFSRCESRSALGTQLPWLNWPLPWTWPWALADFSLNLTVRQRKERFTLCVLKSLCTEVWSQIIFNWITSSSQRRGRRAIAPLRTANHNRRRAAAHQVLCPCTQSPDQGHPLQGKRRIKAHLWYSRKQSVNLSEKLTTWEASSVEFKAALCKVDS